jgi:hypothetical protein
VEIQGDGELCTLLPDAARRDTAQVDTLSVRPSAADSREGESLNETPPGASAWYKDTLF